ncbi:hypothetical protein ACFOW4_20815 [Micromonospora sp. GCM10011542]|uniref:hypothetical protein n=1 Tax=Micromonospora sp. GCM10011542 TaxID=3317337 RepID=UPI00361A07C3
MTSRSTSTSSHWRITWAERENERRRRAHRTETEAWLRRQDHLTRLRIEAAGFLGCTEPRTGLPVDLDDGELVFRVLPAAELVEAEARHLPGLPPPGPLTCADTPGSALPPGLRSVDTGMAIVTSHRVAFAGRDRRREWRYADLLGPAHHPDVPLTLLHTTDRARLAGLLVPAEVAVNARFYLTLAIAVAAGKRPAVVARLDALLEAHQGARPTPPPLAEPDHAPMTALRPDRRAVAVTAVATVVFATLTTGGIGPDEIGSGYRAEARTNGSEAVQVIPAMVPTTPAEPVAPERDAAATKRGAAPVRSAGRVPYGPSSTAKPGTTVRPVGPAAVPSSRPAPPAAAAQSTAPAPPAGAASTPGPAPTSSPPPTTSPTRPAAPAPTTASPSPKATLLTVCLGPLQLPLLDGLLCPPTDS